MQEQAMSILTGLIGNVLWLLLGAFAALFARLIFQTLPARRLWQFANPKALVIVVATSVNTYTGEYYRRATGIGQLRSLSLVVDSIRRAYGPVDARSILMSDEALGERAECDLVLLGGVKNNQLTKNILARQGIVDLQADGIQWRVPGEATSFTPDVQDHSVIKDYGLVVRTTNPFSDGSSKVTIIAGVHTQGVIAAARYFTENAYKELRWRRSGADLVVVVSCDVLDDYPVGVKAECKYERNETFWT